VEFEHGLAGLEAVPRELAQLDADLELELEMEVSTSAGTDLPLLARTDPEQVTSADQRARRIVESAAHHCATVAAIIGGILDGRVGGKYDSIANRSTIGGRDNRRLLAEFASSRNLLEKADSYLRQAMALELQAGA